MHAEAPLKARMLVALFLACAPPPTLSPEAEKGRQIYVANCIACHNADPKKTGAVGPAVAGASRELIEARVVHGTYPPGYKPLRTTTLMVALPHLAADVDALAAFLK